ncbi:MAG TPA: hypothetical protein VHX44_10525 [Planctomycetota bacterium]|nr:hypothetical protein [Planctomycetota bacterium]
MTTRLARIIARLGIRDLGMTDVSLVALCSNGYGTVAWAICLAKRVCLLPTVDPCLHHDPDAPEDLEWMVFRDEGGIAYHLGTCHDLDSALAEACKVVIAARIEAVAAPCVPEAGPSRRPRTERGRRRCSADQGKDR